MPDANQNKLRNDYQQYQSVQSQGQGLEKQQHQQFQPKSNFHSEMSFVSLVLGVLGLIMPLFSTLAIVTGIAGFIQIHRVELKGRWMALTGIILGVLGIILFLLAILFGIEFVQSMMPTGSEEMLAKIMAN